MARRCRQRLPRPLSLPLLLLRPWAVQSHPEPYVSPNPPACAMRIADIFMHLTGIAVKITSETLVCSAHFGFHNEVLYSGNSLNYPLSHDEYICAVQILGTIASMVAVVSDWEAIMFNCGNVNQACQQTATAAVKLILAAGATLSQAVQLCQPEGGAAPYFPGSDIPVQGWFCWMKVWSTVTYLMNAGKFSKTAWETCAEPQPKPHMVQPAPEPQPEPHMVQPAPGVVVTLAPGAAAVGAGGGAVTAEAAQNETLGVMSLETGKMPQTFEYAEGWGQLQQPDALRAYRIVAASERRLAGFLAAAPWDLEVA